MTKRKYSGDIKESHIRELFEQNGKRAVLVESLDENGNRTAQTYILNGYYRSHPDIEVFELENDSEVVLRVEVKGFLSLQNNEVRKNGKVLPVSKKQFNSYLELFMLTEVPIKIIFVIGREEPYEYYWEYAHKMNAIKKASGYHFEDNKPCYFWRPEDLRKGLKGFLD